MSLELVIKENVNDIFSKYVPSKRSNNQKIEHFEILMDKLKFSKQDHDVVIKFLSTLESTKPRKTTTFFGTEIDEDIDVYLCIFSVPYENDLGFTVSFITQKDFDLLCDNYYYDKTLSMKIPRFYKKEHIKRK